MEYLTSALWTAMLEEDYDLARQLICSGANVNERRRTGNNREMTTLLHVAAAVADVELVSLLINRGANCHARDTRNCTPLNLAMTVDDRPDVVEVLINAGANVDSRDRKHFTPLLLAVYNGFHQSAEKLIARGASIEAVVEDGWSALHLASMSSSVNLNIVKMLISHGINVDAENDDGITPLQSAACRCGNTDLIQLFLDNGADVNKKARDLSGDFPLYLATSTDYAIVHLLLKSGARVNEANNSGNTALHEACENELDDVAALLVKFGADINARNCKGEVAFEQLPNSPSSEATARIIIREAVKREALSQIVYEEYKQMVQSYERYSRFDRECREEVERMRSERIDVEDSAVSFFDIFSKNEEKLAELARNNNIVTAFESSDYLTSFRIYASNLTTNFEMAKERANFLMSVEDFLVEVFGDILPAPIVQKLAAYIKYGDIIANEL